MLVTGFVIESNRMLQNITSFNTKFAEIHGVNAAILLETLGRWIDYSKIEYEHRNNFTFQNCITVKYEDGRYWKRMTSKALIDIFPFYNRHVIREIYKECMELDLIRVEMSSDDFSWISIGDTAFPYCALNEKTEDKRNAKIDRYGGNADYIHRRDGEKCAICGGNNRLAIHHIDGFFETKPENNAANKMILLCASCHRKVHGKKNVTKIPKKELERIGYFGKE